MRLFVKNNLKPWVTIGGLFASLNLVCAQTAVEPVQSTSTNDRVSALPSVKISTPQPAGPDGSGEIAGPVGFPDRLPRAGNPGKAPVRNLGDDSDPLDGGPADIFAVPERIPSKGRLRLKGMGRSGTEAFHARHFTAREPRLNPPGQSNGITSFQLHDSRAEDAYTAWGKPGLIAPDWKIEKEVVWGATNQDAGSDTIPVYGPVNLLCRWQRDSTGDRGLFFSVATTNSRSGTIYDGRIGVRYGGGPCSGHPFVIQGRVSF